jgi:hypothetical protein
MNAQEREKKKSGRGGKGQRLFMLPHLCLKLESDDVEKSDDLRPALLLYKRAEYRPIRFPCAFSAVPLLFFASHMACWSLPRIPPPLHTRVAF